MNQDASGQFADLEALLDEALAPEKPSSELSDRIVAATADAVDHRFEALLHEALAPDQAPEGMEDRIVARVMDAQAMRRKSVAGTIGRTMLESWRIAAAAAIVLAYGAGIMLSLKPAAPPDRTAQAPDSVNVTQLRTELNTVGGMIASDITYFDEGDQQIQVIAMDMNMDMSEAVIMDGLFTPEEAKVTFEEDVWSMTIALPYDLF